MGRLAAVHNVFAFVMLVILLMVLPRYTESLHPGKDGNPGFNSYDLDNSLRAVFYPPSSAGAPCAIGCTPCASA